MAFLPFTRPTLDQETIDGVVEVLRSGWITTGPKVREFEAALSGYLGGRHVRVFNSGTVTMEIALRIAGIGPGHEVITTPLTWVATANVVLAVGARPVFVDIDPLTRNIDLDLVEAAITPRTRAILPVYLAGLPVDLDRLYDIAARHGLRVIEDAAQAMGSTWNGQRVGSRGDLISFSFHANKNMTTIEGGALVLNHQREVPLCEQLRFQGVQRFGEDGIEVEFPGEKANLTDVAARVGLGQLERLDGFNDKRKRLARRYFRAFDRALGCELPPADFDHSNWHMFQVVLPLHRMRGTRADFIAAMRAEEIGIGVHYPAIHLFKLYRSLGWREGQFPHAERVGQGIVTLPLFPGMSEGDVERVCTSARRVLSGMLQ